MLPIEQSLDLLNRMKFGPGTDELKNYEFIALFISLHDCAGHWPRYTECMHALKRWRGVSVDRSWGTCYFMSTKYGYRGLHAFGKGLWYQESGTHDGYRLTRSGEVAAARAAAKVNKAFPWALL